MKVILCVLVVAFVTFALIMAQKLNDKDQDTESIGEDTAIAKNEFQKENTELSEKVSNEKINALLDSVNTIKYCLIFFVVLQILSIIGAIIVISEIGSLF